MHTSILPLAIALLATGPAPLHADAAASRWGALGHRIVVTLAWDHLTPTAKAAAERLLAGESLGDAAVWADKVRPQRRQSAPWHYVNVPAGTTAWDAERWCPRGDCIVGAIHRFRRELGDATASDSARAEALRFLMHFLGDMHQPLHVGDRGDRGGNDFKVRWRKKDTNLHSVWDGDLLTAWSVDEGGYLKRLRDRIGRMTPGERTQMASGTIEGWVIDGGALSKNVAYTAPEGGTIPADYLGKAGPVLDLVLIQAGLRLARVLNETLDTVATR